MADKEQSEDLDHNIDIKSEDLLSTVLPKSPFKHRYKTLKRKLKLLLYEQECFREELVKIQKKILRVSMDKNFLLDRLLKYENVPLSSSDEDGTASSSNESEVDRKRKKTRHGNDGSSNKSKSNKDKKKKTHISKKSSNQHGFPNNAKDSNGRTSSGDKLVRCAYVTNGKPCQEIVSKSSKFSYCKHHRTVIRIGPKNGSNSSKSSKVMKYSLMKKGYHSKKGKEGKKSPKGEFSRLSTDTAMELSQDVFSDDFEEKIEQATDEIHSSLDDLIEEDLVIDMPE